MTKQEVFDVLFAQFIAINGDRDRLISAAKTFEQGEQVMNAWRPLSLTAIIALSDSSILPFRFIFKPGTTVTFHRLAGDTTAILRSASGAFR